jgi:hypothetical protein
MNVGHRSFSEGERLPVHYFEDTLGRDRLGRRRYVDEDRKPVGRPPRGLLVGETGLGNYRTVDDAVSEALGITLAS